MSVRGEQHESSARQSEARLSLRGSTARTLAATQSGAYFELLAAALLSSFPCATGPGAPESIPPPTARRCWKGRSCVGSSSQMSAARRRGRSARALRAFERSGAPPEPGAPTERDEVGRQFGCVVKSVRIHTSSKQSIPFYFPSPILLKGTAYEGSVVPGSLRGRRLRDDSVMRCSGET